MPVSSCYYREIRSIEKAVKNAAGEATQTLFGVAPTEIGRFMPLLEKDGASISESLLSLFVDLLQREIMTDNDINESFRSLDRKIRDLPNHLGVLPSRRSLHELVARCLHETCPGERTDVRFGDVYRPDPQKDEYELVISPECDLVERPSTTRGPRDVLLICGKKVSDVRSGSSPTNIFFQPFYDPSATSPCWLEWNINQPKVRRYRGLAVNLRDKRVHKMRFAEADWLQQEFAARLTRVGTERYPHATQTVTCTLRWGDQELFGTVDITFVRGNYGDSKPRGKVTELAVGPCIDALLNHAVTLELSPDDVLRLRCYRKTSDFMQELERKGLLLLKRDDNIVLFKGDKGSLPKGTEKWSP